MAVTQSTTLTAFALRKRPAQSVRLARAAKVLRRFDLQMLMLAAQASNTRSVRLWVDVRIEAGELNGPRLRGRRNIDGLEWAVAP